MSKISHHLDQIKFSSIEEILDDFKQGKMVIMVDDEDRENEGDLIVASEKISPDKINFMSKYGRGLICLTLTSEKTDALNLPLMVSNNSEQYGTNFTVSIEAAKGVTTGISAHDRATTVLAAIDNNATEMDIVMPGHIFPLRAQPGGVLTRAGHTEAGCDLARLSGLTPSSVIVEILNDDGTMARRDDLMKFSKLHKIKIGTIADLIEYRNIKETTIEKISEIDVDTIYGIFSLHTYKDLIDGRLHYALKKGDIGSNTLVRVHLQDTMADIFQIKNFSDSLWSLESSMKKISEEGGVLVFISNEQKEANFLNKVKKNQINSRTCQQVSRNIGVGSQILSDLNVSTMRLLSSSDQKYHALSGFGLEITEYITK